MKSLRYILLSLVLIALFSSIACANTTCNFVCITNNVAYNAACGESALSVDVKDARNSKALFTFLNCGSTTNAGVIEEIIFEDTSGLLSFSAFNPFEKGVNFQVNTKKNINLPGGNEPEVDFTESYGFAANKSAPSNGIELGESLGIVFDYTSGSFDALMNEIQNGNLRIGIHVISFEDEGSESFVTTTKVPPIVPVPGAVVLACIGIVTVLRTKKKFS